jgi:hypothetical protein
MRDFFGAVVRISFDPGVHWGHMRTPDLIEPTAALAAQPTIGHLLV